MSIELLYRNATKTRLPRVKKSKLHQKYTTTIELLYGVSRIYKVFWRGGTGRGGTFAYLQNTILHITSHYSTRYYTLTQKNKKKTLHILHPCTLFCILPIFP
jgi:hypothetical protein